MKVLFVVPAYPGHVREYLILPSLELCINSAILKAEGHSVKLFDMKIDQISIENAREALFKMNYNPDIVLIDDTPEVHCVTKKLIPIIKEMYIDAIIALRGEIGSFEPDMVLRRNTALDFVIRYDDDYAFKKIIEAIQNGTNQFDNINNIAYRIGDNVYITREQPRDYDLDSLPYPDRHLYDISKYLRRDSETIVRSSRGCPGKCLFCIKTRYESFGVFSIKRFVDEIEELQKLGFESFFFSDDTFAFSDTRLKEFAEEVKRRNLNIRFTSNIRIKDINEYKVKTLKEIGAYRVFVGIETINASSSSIIKKNLNVQEIRDKLNLLHKYNIEFHASFILGSPNDTERDLEETIKFVKEIKPTVVTFNLIKAYPGLPIYNDPETYGMLIEDKYWFEKDEWSTRCVMGTQLLPPSVLEKWSRRMLFEFIEGI